MMQWLLTGLTEKKMAVKKILGIIENEAGAQFDPKVVKAFLKIFHEGKID